MSEAGRTDAQRRTVPTCNVLKTVRIQLFFCDSDSAGAAERLPVALVLRALAVLSRSVGAVGAQDGLLTRRCERRGPAAADVVHADVAKLLARLQSVLCDEADRLFRRVAADGDADAACLRDVLGHVRRSVLL